MDSGRFLLRQYGYFVVELYHIERNHQGLDNRLIVPMETIASTKATVQTRERLGGLLNYYYKSTCFPFSSHTELMTLNSSVTFVATLLIAMSPTTNDGRTLCST